MKWKDLHHSELSTSDLYQLLALRNQVFIVEQQCVYQDIDGADLLGNNRHLLGFIDGELAAYSRLLVPEDQQQPLSIGRVIVAPFARGRQLGHQLLKQTLLVCSLHYPERSLYLSAQSHLQGFYAAQGFVVCTEPYSEDGIEHIGMELQVAKQ
ncbi:GNAT family N-acetyltransferase [Tatumella citrea]|uniref:Protein ElaA n=1 Tax=Tatumella citrea TaxID=53336 RepID=A0A1Y0LQG1_TATCI|nr:GNAT family N-acetyltransferase [Tatumella citrea]ARU96208.1 acyltransferase [Tatumella citrea]ARV00244.1 acyltransferase [Tatumella citrea]